MNEKEYQLFILDGLEKNETILSELYKAYGEKFVFKKKFWDDMVEDELNHAKWIETLRKKIEEGEVLFAENRFNRDLLEDFYKNIQGKIREIGGEFGIREALGEAIRIENHLVEKKFFEVFKGDSVDLEIVLLALKYSTENHLKRVTEEYKAEASAGLTKTA